MTTYKATPEQWVNLERRQLGGNDLVCAALELRARVEVLEDAAQKHIIETSSNILALASRVEVLEAFQQQPEPIDQEENDRRFHACMDLIRNATPKQIRASAGLPERSSLVERVAIAISRCEDSSCWDDEAVNWEPEARAAIREVAAWLRSQDLSTGDYWAGRLEQEAGR